ncbi:uncharacterized protein LOC113235816 isoform X2 [Hyposmocoma kahamanoa]|uniref:uncharacterized protein LOC113235816 isoform X2 n=1 Tax=Hyposmocoma kahamanoa TaxID=1477025 RepID=UPI000E6D6B4E|nr:uncharacterized protein LOC113235816 isoform X2 [Hyposmocoma kahamanoa]
MSLDRTSADEYFVTALQIFEHCGAESAGALRVDALMDKFAPFVKTNKAEYTYLRSLLDPEHSNPEINVTKLATALHEYSESQKSKADLDESFNLKGGIMPQDSDSGISSDGFQLVEELQSELREKAHLAHKLRTELDFTDRQHEEALAALSAERDSLRSHLNMLRDENITLTHVRRDYEDACDRLCNSELALGETRQELDKCKRNNRVLEEHVSELEIEKSALQELLTKSKDECHRINEMYASRQSALLEENETLKTENADLSTRLQDQEEFMQQIIKEKVLLEMELKELLNKSNQTQLRLDRSIDVSYTDEQMLTALDTLNADSRFTSEHQLLDEESFLCALKEDQGRPTNMSLFDEIRLSFCLPRQNASEVNENQFDNCIDNFENCCFTIGTQTDEDFDENDGSKYDSGESLISQTEIVDKYTQGTQTEDYICDCKVQDNSTQPELVTIESSKETNNNIECIKCFQCEKLHNYSTKLECDLKLSQTTIKDLQQELATYEGNLDLLDKFLDEGKDTNNYLQTVVHSLQSKLGILEAAVMEQTDRLDVLNNDKCSAECQTESDVMSVSTQVEVPCADCVKRNTVVPHSGLRRYLWDPLKCLFQIFAVVCFLCAVSVLYGVSRRWNARCVRDASPVPWRWFNAQDFMDLLLRIEYVADVPM